MEKRVIDDMTLREFKYVILKKFIQRRLEVHGWNIQKTARSLRTPRSNLYKLMKKFELKEPLDGIFGVSESSD